MEMEEIFLEILATTDQTVVALVAAQLMEKVETVEMV